MLSYLVAAAAVLDVLTKQRLLEAPDTAARLAQELKLLRQESAVLGKLPSLPHGGSDPAADQPQLTHRPRLPGP